MKARIAILLALSMFAGCRCAPPLQVLAPKIEIGDPYDPTFSVCATNFIKDCKYDYGEVGIGRPKLFSFVIKNPTNVDLNILSLKIDGSPNFTLEGDVPDVVLAANGAVGKIVTVKYNPQTETAETAKVIITSDAENLAKGENVEIDLNGHGKDLGCPVLTVNPAQCDFGAVGVGATGSCSLTLQNDGTQDLEISDIGFSADTDTTVFAPAGVFPIPAFIQAGTGSTISFTATPRSASAVSGTLVVTSNDCQNGVQNIPLTVQGANTPTAVARVKSVNGTPNNQTNPPVAPLDDVILSGDQSTPGSGGATITAYAWSIRSKPPESSLSLSSPSSVDTGFEFDSANGTVSGIDVAGTFVIALTVTDSNGAVSQNDATVTINAVPTEGLHVQLTWSASVDDIDLHLEKGNNPQWCSDTNDCYYADCKDDFGFGGTPNWDSASGFTAGDPRLDIDDLNGFGPENINIVTPVNGTYIVGVHAYSGNPNPNFTGTDVEVKIFIGGALQSSMTGHLNATDDFWTVAKVDVNGSTTVTPIDTMSQKPASCF